MAFNLVIFLLFLWTMGNEGSEIVVNHKEVVLKKGDEVDLICTVESEALGCSFKSPADQDYNMLQVVKSNNQISNFIHKIS